MKLDNKNTQKPDNSQKDSLKIDTFKVMKVRLLPSGSVTFDMELNGITIYGCFVNTSKDGHDFISLPQRKGTDGKFYSIVYARFSDEDTKAIIEEVENVYKQQ